MCTSLHVGMCKTLHVFLCTALHMGMCTTLHVGIWTTLHMGMCTTLHVGMCATLHVGMCTTLHVGLCTTFRAVGSVSNDKGWICVHIRNKTRNWVPARICKIWCYCVWKSFQKKKSPKKRQPFARSHSFGLFLSMESAGEGRSGFNYFFFGGAGRGGEGVGAFEAFRRCSWRFNSWRKTWPLIWKPKGCTWSTSNRVHEHRQTDRQTDTPHAHIAFKPWNGGMDDRLIINYFDPAIKHWL